MEAKFGRHENLSTEVSESSATVVERLKALLEAASGHNPNDADKPVANFLTDRDSQWRRILPWLRALMPQLPTHDLRKYSPDDRTGPAIWLRCVNDRVLGSPGLTSFPGDPDFVVNGWSDLLNTNAMEGVARERERERAWDAPRGHVG